VFGAVPRGWVRVPAQDAYKRFFGKFSQTDNLRVADYFFRWLLEVISMTTLRLILTVVF